MNSPQSRLSLIIIAALVLTAPSVLLAQAPPINYQSTDIHSDGTVTFYFKDPGASNVTLNIRDLPKTIPMAKDDTGVWTVTSPPLPPAVYNYVFIADGESRLDPYNPHVAIKFQNVTNLLNVPGTAPQPWQPQSVPHGELHHHFYNTKQVLNLPGNVSDYYVYTPPGYDPQAKTPYPVLYLLHGFNEGPYSWTTAGLANVILDNLIAKGTAKRMVVVMPLGYGDMNYVQMARNQTDPAEQLRRFKEALLTEVMPQVEANYHVATDRDNRAIAGLSMGGQESLTIGLTNTDKFAWVLGLSAAAQGIPTDPALANLNPKDANLRLLWVSCGTEDSLSAPNAALADWLKSKNMPVTYVQTPGVHGWIVWQDNLAHFAPLLFQPK